MRKNTRSEKLVQELAAMPQALKGASLSANGDAVILARLVQGLSCESWRAACEDLPLNQWHALPVHSDTAQEEDALDAASSRLLPITPFREVAGALTPSAFMQLLQRELVRLSRNGGSLSLVSAALADHSGVVAALGEVTASRLEATLGSVLLGQMDACDALGLVRHGVFICSLPGLGQLAARRFAEKAQEDFTAEARPFFPGGGINAGNAIGCALGIVNILQGEACAPAELIRRARSTLDIAMRKSTGHIHQEAAMAPFEGTTLVHSSEKRFLFFGGDLS